MQRYTFGDPIQDHVALKRYATQLVQQGFVVIPMTRFESTMPVLRSEILREASEWKEFMAQPVVPSRWVGGGFSALGNPSSFHSIMVREIRWGISMKLVHFWSHLQSLLPHLAYQQQVVDRLMIRPQGASVTAESWHRDLCPAKQRHPDMKQDLILGGWINLSDVNQDLSCVPATHLLLHQGSESEQKRVGFAPLDPNHFAQYNASKVRVLVPSGHLLLFDESLIHEITGGKAKQQLVRLFIAWRLTSNRVVPSLFGSQEDWRYYFEDRGVPRIKSHQIPPMYPKMWSNVHKDKLKAFSKRVHPRARTKSGLVQRFMPSLHDMKLIDSSLTPAYSDEEQAIYKLQAVEPLVLEEEPATKRRKVTVEIE